MQQHAGKFAGLDVLLNLVQGLLLLGAELEIEWRRTGLVLRDGEIRRLVEQLDHLSFNKRVESRAGQGKGPQMFDRKFSSGGRQGFDQSSLIGVKLAFR